MTSKPIQTVQVTSEDVVDPVITLRGQHFSTSDGWFYVTDDGIEVGPFVSEWEMFKYCEDRDIHKPQNQEPK